MNAIERFDESNFTHNTPSPVQNVNGMLLLKVIAFVFLCVIISDCLQILKMFDEKGNAKMMLQNYNFNMHNQWLSDITNIV